MDKKLYILKIEIDEQDAYSSTTYAITDDEEIARIWEGFNDVTIYEEVILNYEIDPNNFPTYPGYKKFIKDINMKLLMADVIAKNKE